MNRTKVLIDWLQVNCRGKLNIYKNNDFKLLNMKSKHFGKLYEVYRFGELFCSIACEPLSSILNPDIHLVKISNKYLYRNFNVLEILSYLDSVGLWVHGLSRLDLACDFNNFLNNLHPENLIKNFLNNYYLKTSKNKYKLHGWQGKIQNFEYIRFGTYDSEISSYLYNKSQEFKDKVYKPYIEDVWQQSDLNIIKDVWRLEFSIKGNNLHLVEVSTGEIEKFDLSKLCSQEYLTNLYIGLLKKHFSFKINTEKVKKEYMPFVHLFDFKDSVKLPCILRNCEPSNRMNKIFIKMLEGLNIERRNILKETVPVLDSLIFDYCNKYALESFYENKIKGFSDVDLMGSNNLCIIPDSVIKDIQLN